MHQASDINQERCKTQIHMNTDMAKKLYMTWDVQEVFNRSS